MREARDVGAGRAEIRNESASKTSQSHLVRFSFHIGPTIRVGALRPC